jgi:hypothetical protein
MKTLFALAALAALMNAQPVAKPAPETPKVDAALTERALTEAEVLKIRATSAEIKNLSDTYKVEEFNKKVEPKATERQGVFIAACRSIQIPEDKIQTECRFVTGLDADGNTVMDPTGKPVKARVWRERPATAETPKDPAVTAKK